MLYDTDAIIWFKRGVVAIAEIMADDKSRSMSLQTYLELVQGAKDRRQLAFARRFIDDFSFAIVPIDQAVGSLAARLVERFALSHGMRAGDALVAATALENDMVLCTANIKHFRQIPDLKLMSFRVTA